MSQHTANAHDSNDQLGWDPLDPHGTGQHSGHGHIVVGWKLQLGVLLSLLFFTVLTVAFYNAEKWVEVAFGIHLPGWVNVIGAMSIATVKAVLVCAFFMQLRYDKALNTFAMLFCLFAVSLFLFFAILDLSTRGWVTDYKYGEVNTGGTGYGLDLEARDAAFDARVSPRLSTGGGDINTARREEAIALYIEDHPGKTVGDWWADHYHHMDHPHKHPADEEDYFEQYGFGHSAELPTANVSHERTGLTPGLFSNTEPSEGHGGGHGDHHGSDHSDDHGDDH